MVLLSDLPRGLMQAWASVNDGMWYARSAEFMGTGLMDTLRWMRVIGDTIFAIGVLALGWFVLGLKTGWSVTSEVDPVMQEEPQSAGSLTVASAEDA
jgi:nitric oxide reductase subunit B